MDCIFCKIAGKEIPSKILFEDNEIIAFHDIDAQAPVHFLVIPKTHIASCGEISSANSFLVGHIFEAIAKLAKQLDLKDGYRVVTNTGRQAGQSVAHLHFHVLAGRDMTWPPG